MMIGTRVRATNALQLYCSPRDFVIRSVHPQEPDLAENVQQRAVARCGYPSSERAAAGAYRSGEHFANGGGA